MLNNTIMSYNCAIDYLIQELGEDNFKQLFNNRPYQVDEGNEDTENISRAFIVSCATIILYGGDIIIDGVKYTSNKCVPKELAE